MTATPFQIALLIVCWVNALVTLVIFLESWFALTRRSRLRTLRSSSDAGVVTVLVPVRGDAQTVRRTLRSVLGQSYPFIELLLLYHEGDQELLGVVREFCATRSRVPVRPVRVGFRLDFETERVRALEQASSGIRGAWVLVLDSDVVLERRALESALEFVRNEEITALALTPGLECRSFAQKLFAPSLEWFVRMIRVADRGRERSGRFNPVAPFMLFHGHTHSVINRMNRMPGILNESGWTLWSYKVEGLRTFQGDGTGWIFREASPSSLLSRLQTSPLAGSRAPAFLLGSTAIALVTIAGILFGLSDAGESFLGRGTLYLSAFSYSLMATSFFFYSRRLGAAAWFAPFWFLAHCWALALIVSELGRSKPAPPDLTALPSSSSELSTRK